MAIKITGSAQNYRVGRVSGNTPIFFRPYIFFNPNFGQIDISADSLFKMSYLILLIVPHFLIKTTRY